MRQRSGRGAKLGAIDDSEMEHPQQQKQEPKHRTIDITETGDPNSNHRNSIAHQRTQFNMTQLKEERLNKKTEITNRGNVV
mmetsp:Transcript_11181/g.30936  ORF Transcript_11181/g.30936 Transcript_11181/m.30936 type:complete len:81 (+) Transcript_11181:496-738(+)